MPGLIDAVAELAHLGFERLDRRARHGLADRQADLGEPVAQYVDCLIETAGLPQRVDPTVDQAKLQLEAGQFLGFGARQGAVGAGYAKGAGCAKCGGAARRIGLPLVLGGLARRLVGSSPLGSEHVARVPACTFTALRLESGESAFRNQLLDPAVESRDGVDQTTR